MNKFRFERLWRNKWLTSEARTISEMINMLECAVLDLRQMYEDGVILDLSASDMGSDYANLITDNAGVAFKHDMGVIIEDDEISD